MHVRNVLRLLCIRHVVVACVLMVQPKFSINYNLYILDRIHVFFFLVHKDYINIFCRHFQLGQII